MARKKKSHYNREKQQIITSKTTWGAIFRSKPFQEGYREVLKGISPDYDKYPISSGKAWAYERGRFFGIYIKSKNLQDIPLKKGGNKLDWDMVFLFCHSISNDNICT